MPSCSIAPMRSRRPYNFDIPVHVTETLMKSLGDRERLAREVLGFAATLPRA